MKINYVSLKNVLLISTTVSVISLSILIIVANVSLSKSNGDIYTVSEIIDMPFYSIGSTTCVFLYNIAIVSYVILNLGNMSKLQQYWQIFINAFSIVTLYILLYVSVNRFETAHLYMAALAFGTSSISLLQRSEETWWLLPFTFIELLFVSLLLIMFTSRGIITLEYIAIYYLLINKFIKIEFILNSEDIRIYLNGPVTK